MIEQIFAFCFVAVYFICLGVLVWVTASFMVEAPKQLKRIADALEKDDD